MLGEAIGVFGGTFNPIHNGHIKLACSIMERLQLSCVILVPSRIPPHKSLSSNVLPMHRMEMCRLACEQYDKLYVSDIEIGQNSVSYTYLTLERLCDQFPSTPIYFIVGADMFLSLRTWKNYKRIFELASICTVPREKHGIVELKNFAKFLNSEGAVTFVEDVVCPNISSTVIRKMIVNGEDISKYVPRSVNEYILKKHLYMEG